MLFISHRTADKEAALDLLERAKKQGYSEAQLFLDSDPESGIDAGQDWEEVLYDRLKQSRALIVLCSPNWLTSKWCFVELGYAKAMAIKILSVFGKSPTRSGRKPMRSGRDRRRNLGEQAMRSDSPNA